MALCYTRLLCRRSINLHNFRSLYTCSPLNVAASKSLASTVCESHDDKNMRLKRPMSPHLTIYQIQLTSFMSLTHRTTGIILSTYAVALGLGTLFVPGGIPCVIEMVGNLNLPAAALFAGKFLAAVSATFHTFNGLRHLAWDTGMFLTIKEVYSTGYAVAGLSAIAGLILAAQ